MYAVGRGSSNESYLVSLFYQGDPENKEKVVAFIGKGVCFDTGGLSIKTAGMEKMYGDKGGACTV